jgi:hypothetical protein
VKTRNWVRFVQYGRGKRAAGRGERRPRGERWLPFYHPLPALPRLYHVFLRVLPVDETAQPPQRRTFSSRNPCVIVGRAGLSARQEHVQYTYRTGDQQAPYTRQNTRQSRRDSGLTRGPHAGLRRRHKDFLSWLGGPAPPRRRVVKPEGPTWPMCSHGVYPPSITPFLAVTSRTVEEVQFRLLGRCLRPNRSAPWASTQRCVGRGDFGGHCDRNLPRVPADVLRGFGDFDFER